MRMSKCARRFGIFWRYSRGRVELTAPFNGPQLYWSCKGRVTQSVLSRAHSTPSAQRTAWQSNRYSPGWPLYLVEGTLSEARNSTLQQVETVGKLSEVASKHPYYKYNSMWTREIQNVVGLELWSCGNHLIEARARLLCFVDGSVPFQTDRAKGSLGSSLPLKKLERFFKVSMVLTKAGIFALKFGHSAGKPKGPRYVPLSHRGVSTFSDQSYWRTGMRILLFLYIRLIKRRHD